MKKIQIVAGCMAASMLFSSCGVIFGGSKYNASIIVKDHPQATIYANGERIGVGKAEKLLPREESLSIKVEQEGCPTQTKVYYKAFRGGNFVLTVLSWGLVGVIVDLASGASYKPDHLNNPDVIRLTTKNFVYNVDYEDCDGAGSSGDSKEDDEIEYAR